MINTSNEYKTKIIENRIFYSGAKITLADSTVLTLNNSSIRTFRVDDATSQSGTFVIGSALINRLVLSIDNIDGIYSAYDFTDAVIRPTTGLQLSGTVETLKKGVFTVDEAKALGSVISITALDNMNKFDTPFSDVTIVFPTTSLLLLNAVCNHCGVALATQSFLNDTHIITKRPDDTATTCREIVAWIAQMSGNFARCNGDGQLELKWYDIGAFESEDNIDGGVFDNGITWDLYKNKTWEDLNIL